MRRMSSWSQKIKVRTLPADFRTRNELRRGGVSRYTATALIVVLSLGHSDITSLCPWSPIVTGNHLDSAETKKFNWHLWCSSSAFRHFKNHFAERFRMYKSSWMIDSTHSHEMPRCSAIDLAKILWSSKISSWIWSIISRVVTILGSPGWGASQVEKSRLNWATQFFMVAYNGACSPNVSCRMTWIRFDALPCRK